MIFFKKKELVKAELEFDKKFVVKTKEGEFSLFLVGKDIYCRGLMSKDSRYGLAYIKHLDIGENLEYHNPRLDSRVDMGRIRSISTF